MHWVMGRAGEGCLRKIAEAKVASVKLNLHDICTVSVFPKMPWRVTVVRSGLFHREGDVRVLSRNACPEVHCIVHVVFHNTRADQVLTLQVQYTGRSFGFPGKQWGALFF